MTGCAARRPDAPPARRRDGDAERASRTPPKLRLTGDGSVERGGCWLECEQGVVDATVGGRAARLLDALREHR